MKIEPIPTRMHAVVTKAKGGYDVLTCRQVPVPLPAACDVLIPVFLSSV